MQLVLAQGMLVYGRLHSDALVPVQDRWKKIHGVQFHHLGQIQFRDTPEEYTLLQVNSERYHSV